jgi:hypothetical protein
MHYANLDDVLYNPIFYKVPYPTFYEDEGLVFADCGCLDMLRSYFHNPYDRLSLVMRTEYHQRSCMLAYFPIEHIGKEGVEYVKMWPDHLITPSWKLMMDHDATMFEHGYISGYHAYNFFEEDTLWRFAEIIRKFVDSINTVPKTRNWAAENWAYPH